MSQPVRRSAAVRRSAGGVAAACLMLAGRASLIACLALACVGVPAVAAGEPTLRISWSEGPEYPMGIQDSACGIIDGFFISAGGFSRHPKDVLDKYPDAFGGQRSGFTRLVFGLDLTRPEKGWTRLPDMPGPARQASAAVVVGGALYGVGGFNYSEPFTYRSTCRLEKVRGKWQWTDIGCDTPWPVCEANAVAIGAKIYLIGAADYFGPGESRGAENFYTDAGRSGDPVGRALLVLDTNDLRSGWKRLADLPGKSRSFCSAAAAGGRIWVLSGLNSPSRKAGEGAEFFNVVDGWTYDPARDKWEPLPDVPDNANVRAVTFRDRYLVLLGGYKYAYTLHRDGTRTQAQTGDEMKQKMGALISKKVLVYDTVARTFGEAAPLLDQTSWPLAAVVGNTVCCLGGEGGARLWHPATFQIGTIADDSTVYNDWPE